MWRNRRRTMITSASVFFAVVFALFFRSLQLGSYDHMFRNAIETYTGYIQIQQEGFWEEKTVDNTFMPDSLLNDRLLALENVEATIPRFESFALASSGPKTKGVLVMGVDPAKEQYLSRIREKKVSYLMDSASLQAIRQDSSIPAEVAELAEKSRNSAYTTPARLQLDLGIAERDAGRLMPAIEEHTRFQNGSIQLGDPGAWVGHGLAQYMGLGIGDTIVLIGQGYHATTAAGKYEIKGVLKIPLPDIDNKIVYLPLDICQQLYNAPGNLTSLALAIRDNDEAAIDETIRQIQEIKADGLRVMGWKEMNELLVSQMDADDKSGQIMIGILYLVIAFGVFGTVLMLTAERRREFGVLVAIGMQKRKLASVMSMEMILIGLIGVAAGALVSAVIILYGVEHPLVFKGEMAKMWEEYGMEPKMVFQGIDFYFLWQVAIVCCMVLIALIYPLRKIFGMKVVNALRA